MTLSWVYVILVAIRLSWTLWGQSGYIHPDEFFQSVEVVAGDLLDVEVETTWEFQGSHPIRSIVLPFLICGPSLWILGCFRHLGIFQSIPAPLLLAAPRMTITLIGIAMEIILYKIAKKLHLDSFAVIVMYASSYVAMVYHTRTLSNTLESFLFLALIYLTVGHGKSVHQHKTAKRGDQIKQPYNSVSYFNAMMVGVVISAGIFNRPTFLFFAFMPCVYWIFSDFGGVTMCRKLWTFMQKGVVSGLAALYTSCLFVLCDTVYYTTRKPGTFWYLVVVLTTFQFEADSISTYISSVFKLSVITPLNFFNYNIDSENLADHGLHPRFLHFAVNGPMLFGFAAVFLFWDFITLVFGASRRNFGDLATNTRLMLVLFYIFPVGLLSIFPHQEPRFLIPLITPVCLLYAEKLFSGRKNKIWTTLWIAFNLMASIFFGVLHQGGLISCLTYLQNTKERCTNPETCPTVIFYHTYMPPRFLLANPSTTNPHEFGMYLGYTENLKLPRINVVDFKGALQADLFKEMANQQEEKQIKLVAPASLHKYICQFRFRRRIKIERSFAWHLSMEDPPTWKLLSENYGTTNCEEDSYNSSLFQNFKAAFSLNLYTVS